ncbi:MAG: hypothetical protein JSR33_11885, partial [Proteobacteria bacterium]|nr:hypothetical protein [Pseudomonadota bacterium]
MRQRALSYQRSLLRVHALLQQIGIQLKILATLIDCYSYGLNGAGYQFFERNQTDYQRCAEQYKHLSQLPSETKETPQSLLQNVQQIHQQLDDYLAERLSVNIAALNDELLKNSLRLLQRSLRSMTIKLNGVNTLDSKTHGAGTEDAEGKASVDRALEALKNRVNGLKQGLLKGGSLKIFKNPRFYLSLEMKAPDFVAAKLRQHT